MRTLITLTLLLLLPFLAAAQKYRAVTVMMEKHKLNSGSRAAMGGQSRITLPVTVPPKTKYIYYSISTSENDKSVTLKNGIRLAQQLGAAISGKKVDLATMASAAASVKGQEQDGSIDVYYLTDATMCAPFENKEDKRWRFNSNYSREKFSGGTVGIEITESILSQMLYFGFKNPSAYKAQYFNIEVVAIVRD